MTEEHIIRITLNDQVAIGVIFDIWDQFIGNDVFMASYGALFIDLELSLDDVKFLKNQYGWAITSYCDMNQDSGQDYISLADQD